MMRSFWRGCAVGLAVTVLVGSLYGAGLMRQLEGWALDWRFGHANRQLRQSDEVRIIAIDEQALKQVGRWPWARSHLADLVSVLHEAGAARIALDLHFPEPQPQDDPVLAEAIRRAGNVYLPVAFPVISGRLDLEAAQRRMRELVRADAQADPAQLPKQVGLPAQLLGPDALLRSQMAELLRERFWLRDEDLAEQLLVRAGVDPVASPQHRDGRYAALLERVRDTAGTVKLQVALELVEKHLRDEPAATDEQITRAVVQGREGPVRMESAELAWAIEQARARGLVRDRMPAAGGRLAAPALLMQAGNPYDVQVPVASLGAGAAGFGHVVVPPPTDGVVRFHEPDGVVRRLPLLLRWQGRLVPQLALRLAADMRGYDWERIEVRPGQIVLPLEQGGRVLRLPLDETGQTLLNWAKTGEQWTSSFGGPVPAGVVLEVAALRRAIAANEARWRSQLQRLVHRTQEAELPRYLELRRQEEEILAQIGENGRASGVGGERSGSGFLESGFGEQQRQRAAGDGLESGGWEEGGARAGHSQATQPEMYKSLQDHLQQIRNAQEQIETASMEWLRENAADLPAAIEQESDPAERAKLEELLALYDEVVQGQLRQWIDQSNASLADRLKQRREQLAARLAGKTCLVGHTATGMQDGDLANTPIWKNAPGVMTHAQLLSAMLQERMIWPVSERVNLGLVLMCCVAVTLLTSAMGPRTSLGAMAASCGAFALIASFVLFERIGVAVAMATPLIGMFVTWAMITSYRVLVEERAKRHVSRTLQQYTSPALARQMAENPELVSQAQTREVTCYFSDLRGFTGISERLGAEATQRILNVYLERMTEVLDAHEALINKFLGDGIFAFFNPAIHPQADHAKRACLAALDTVAALEALKAEPDGRECRDLHMRVGLASGLAVVGNCGSERKFDYTCIGDTVNLASRLEGANKALGTGILVNGRCRELAGEVFVFRHIGRLVVVGRAMFEETYELLGRREAVEPAALEAIERFEQAVRCFVAGNLAKAKEGFAECLRARPDDGAARYYMELCTAMEKAGVPTGWTGAVELVAK